MAPALAGAWLSTWPGFHAPAEWRPKGLSLDEQLLRKDPMLTRNQFVRSHGLGNDYLVVDPSVLSFALTPESVRRICDRHRGVGSDGILAYGTVPTGEVGSAGSTSSVVAAKPRAEALLRIYNPDGSEAEKSGNGLRIFCKFLYEHG